METRTDAITTGGRWPPHFNVAKTTSNSFTRAALSRFDTGGGPGEVVKLRIVITFGTKYEPIYIGDPDVSVAHDVMAQFAMHCLHVIKDGLWREVCLNEALAVGIVVATKLVRDAQFPAEGLTPKIRQLGHDQDWGV
jgi:hypothetical protein